MQLSISCCFYWFPLKRQIRIKGEAVRLTDKECDHYWKFVPYERKLAIVVSQEYDEFDSVDSLEKKMDEFKKNFEEEKTERPDYWYAPFSDAQSIIIYIEDVL
ncbi:hypothetical protein ACOME3_002551 [Neoechinorhynchus agilis]